MPRNSRAYLRVHSAEAEEVVGGEEEDPLEARIVKRLTAIGGEGGATPNMGAGVVEGREMVLATVEDMLQIRAKRLSEAQKSRLSLCQQSPRWFYRRTTTKTRTPKSASFAPLPSSTPPSLLATTAHVTSAPSACEHYTRRKLARTAEQNPTTSF